MRFSKMIRNAACAVASVAVLSSCLLFSGCSTPATASTITDEDGNITTFSTGEYLAYLYYAYSQTFYYNNLTYYSYYGMDPWEQTLPYGDENEELSVEDYVQRLTQDTMVRQVALEKLLDEYEITYSEDNLEAYQTVVDSISEDDIIAMGFNKDSYSSMYRSVSLNEVTLFDGLYEEGGLREMTEEEMQAYYDENILCYKMIDISLIGDDGGAFSDEEIEDTRDQLQGYLDMFMDSGDFDAVIDQYTDDTTAEDDTTTTEDSSEYESDTEENVQSLDANTADDENLVNAIKSVAVGEAQIVEYTAGGTTETMSLMLRVDPNETDEYTFEDSYETILYGAKYEEFDEEVDAVVDSLTVDFNSTVVKKCTAQQVAEDEPEA
jgi:hypothetical protein